MAHIDHSFQMQGDPAAAQGMFMRDIAPDLRKDGFFHLVRETPGRLVFNDSLDPEGLPEDEAAVMGTGQVAGDEQELSDERPAAVPLIGGDVAPRSNPTPVFEPLQDALARHLQVEFSAGDAGTTVHIHGHARRAVHDGLERLGTSGHWPEIADRPHD